MVYLWVTYNGYNISIVSTCILEPNVILEKKIDKKVKLLKNKYSSRIYLTLWCVLWSLTTAHRYRPPTIHKLDLVHIIFCGHEVHYIWEWYFYIDNNECNNYPFFSLFLTIMLLLEQLTLAKN